MGLGLIEAGPCRLQVGGHDVEAAITGEIGHADGNHRLPESDRDQRT
jgi:hypothetical protein